MNERVAVREETAEDRAAAYAVEEAAFGQKDEAELVEALRSGPGLVISLVAVEDDEIVGHILFTALTFEDDRAEVLGAGLAPVAVRPDRQRSGIGSALIRAGLERCRAAGVDLVVLLGHPDYYPRFGFRPASELGLHCEYDVPDTHFMALELTPASAAGVAGLVRYAPPLRP